MQSLSLRNILRSSMSDVVNKPNHYMTFPDMEAIDIIRLTLTPEEFAGYCKGNFLKYRLRAGKKDNLEQEIAKSDVYANWLFEANKENQ